MEELDPSAQRALVLTFMAAGIHALMASHPNPEALREAWNREVAAIWATASKTFAGPNPAADAMRAIQAVWESHIPESRA